MGSQGGEHNFRCPCFEDHAKYQKIVDLKDAGLIIYRQNTSNGNGNDKANIVRSTASTSKDIFILHNTKDSEILSADIMPAFEKNQISCPRCRHIIKNAQRLLKSIPKINRNDVLGICDHCRRKLSRSPCEECEEVTKKFVMGIDETKVAKQHVKMWLSKIHRLLKDVVIGEKNILEQKSRILSDANFENLHHNSPVSLREPEVGDLFHSEPLHMSNRSFYSQPGFHKIKKRTTFMDFSGQEINITIPNRDKQFISRSYQGISHDDANSSGSLLELAHNSFKERKSVTDLTLRKHDPRPPAYSLPGKHYAKEHAVTLRRHYSAESVIPHAKYQPEDIIDLSRKYYSEETLLTSISGIIEDQLHKDFGYFFPQELNYAKKIVKKRISSSELIKDTQDKLEAHAKEENLRLEELRKKKREEQENKRLAREEKKKVAERERLAIEEANRLAEEARRLAEDEAKRLAEEERKLLAEQKKQRLDEEKKKQLDKEKKIKLAEKENKVAKKVENLDSLPKRKEISSGKNKTVIEKQKTKEPTTEKQKNKEPAIAKPKIKDTIPEKPKIKEPPPEKPSPTIPEKPKIKEPPPEKPSPTIPEKPKIKEPPHEMPAPEKTKVKEPPPEQSKLKEPPKIKEPPSEKPKAEDPENKEPIKAKEVPKTEDKQAVKQEVKETLNPKADEDFKKLLAEQAKQKEEQRKLKKQQEEEERKAREAAEKKAREMDQVKSADIKPTKKPDLENPDNSKPNKMQEQPTTKELNIQQIKLRKPSGDDLILKLVQLRKATESDRIKAAKDINAPRLLLEHKGHSNTKDTNCVICTDSDIELEIESIVNQRDDGDKMADIIIGPKIFKYKPPIPLFGEIHEEKQMLPIVYKSCFKEDNDNAVEKKVEVLMGPPEEMARKPPPILIPTKGKQVVEQEVPKGVVRYALSDRSFIDKGWTMLPTEKVVRKMNVYRMRPAHPEFDWFEHNKNKRLMTYDTGEKLAEFDDNGRGRWFYKNGRLALDYYDAEETNAQQRFVVFSSGEPDERGRSRPITILATFDYLGNGIVFDHSGKIRLKYNQTEGVVLDRAIGPVSHWKWHTLNDPPVLQQVMIDTQMPHKDPDIVKLGGAGDNKTRPDNEEMLAIEFDNFIKEKSKKLTQKFKPFQIKMKALKINECFSLRVLDQATVYLIFRDGSANFKMNIGMILDHKEIVDTDTAEVGEVSSSLERLPARTDSIAGLQRSVAHAQRVERQRVERERRLRPAEPCGSADRLAAAAARPLRPPFRTLPSATSAATSEYTCKCRKPSSSNVYYDTRLI